MLQDGPSRQVRFGHKTSEGRSTTVDGAATSCAISEKQPDGCQFGENRDDHPSHEVSSDDALEPGGAVQYRAVPLRISEWGLRDLTVAWRGPGVSGGYGGLPSKQVDTPALFEPAPARAG